MKKTSILLLLCVISLTVISCGNAIVYVEDLTSSPTDTSDGDNPNQYRNPIENTRFTPEALYQYFLLDNALARFNVTTGEVTYLCDDPLCAHGTDCTFSDMGFEFCVDEQKHEVCFVSNGRLIKYDMESKRITVLHEIDTTEGAQGNGGAMTALAHGYYWYRDAYAKVFYRVHLDTGTYERLDASYDIPQAYIDGRYYCTDSTSPVTNVYSLDTSMGDKQIILADCVLYYVSFDHVQAPNSGYITFSEWQDGELVQCAYDLTTHQKSAYQATVKSGLTWKDYVCYTQTVSEPRLMGECGLNGKIYNRTGGTVYRYDTATDTEEILFSNDDLVIGMPEVIGGYLVYDFGAFVRHDVFGCPYWQTDGGGKLVIDIATGDYCVYFNTWDKTLTQYQ